MTRYKKTVLAVCCSVFVSACANVPAVPAVYLTGGSKYALLPPSDIGETCDTAARFSAAFRGKEYSVEAWVKADQSGISLAFFNSLGADLGNIQYSGGAVSVSSPIFPHSLKPEYVIADFQLCFYQEAALSKRLGAIGLKFDAAKDSRSGEIRRVFSKGKCIIEITKSKGRVSLVNRLRGYSYRLEGI
jgi:hypothetical protein